jgi:phosphatidylserine/phosphatidylglycerophosphate/cardiolipin synthase-like enzyme
MPAPFQERGILDVHLRALEAARQLIYIEDQYFRSTHISDAIADAVRRWPGLRVVVVTLESQANNWLSGGWTRESYDRIAGRMTDFELYVLRVARPAGDRSPSAQEIDNHAKLMVVDDLFLTVGSCNINDRGFEFEGEINIAITDPKLVKAARLDIWREHPNQWHPVGHDVT